MEIKLYFKDGFRSEIPVAPKPQNTSPDGKNAPRLKPSFFIPSPGIANYILNPEISISKPNADGSIQVKITSQV
ncbi:hypothetical protein, partial [Terasakiella brassicae]|uniref:hypothetical protein n=1 Tax=Terasakiella brassicae TaxID=1634917 RepID=UPI001E3E4BE9